MGWSPWGRGYDRLQGLPRLSLTACNTQHATHVCPVPDQGPEVRAPGVPASLPAEAVGEGVPPGVRGLQASLSLWPRLPPLPGTLAPQLGPPRATLAGLNSQASPYPLGPSAPSTEALFPREHLFRGFRQTRIFRGGDPTLQLRTAGALRGPPVEAPPLPRPQRSLGSEGASPVAGRLVLSPCSGGVTASGVRPPRSPTCGTPRPAAGCVGRVSGFFLRPWNKTRLFVLRPQRGRPPSPTQAPHCPAPGGLCRQRRRAVYPRV